MPSLYKAFPLPPPRDMGMWNHYPVAAYFWDLPYATVFWTFVGLCALAVVAYHATRLRRVWQS